jgi:SNF2 family DNA or RNA helicase
MSNQSQSFSPRMSTGGIIADDMGLGKTLTILSAIVHSMDEACHFILPSGQMVVNDHLAYPVKATLVVVPSTRKSTRASGDNCQRKLSLSELIEVWKSEIAR